METVPVPVPSMVGGLIKIYDLFLVDVESEEKCVENICQITKLLPRPIFIVMRYFFAFLNQ
jgi:hypothetical protein